MATAETTQTTKTPPARRKLRRAGKKKLMTKIRTDKEFAKTFFEAKSKRSTDKKAAFRKKKSRKK